MKISVSYLCLLLITCIPASAQDSPDFKNLGDSQENPWVAPPPIDESTHNLRFIAQADYQADGVILGQSYSMIDISAKRPLDENSVFAEGLLRVEKNLSTSDQATDIELRLARISYLQPWLQVNVGRFDLFEMVTPNLFFGGYPLMGIHRVDGVMATVPFSFFFNLGESKSGQAQSSSPLALSIFYTPSLFSAEYVAQDLTQSFWLSQLRFRVDSKDFQSTFRVNLGESANDFFNYSSLNGGLTGSATAELRYNSNYALTAEYGIQNLQELKDTSALTLGFQASKLGTWGDFSLDQIGLEAQFPIGSSLLNPFTGGNGFETNLATAPQASWYGKIRARLRVLFIEFHVTNNQDDYTFSRLVPGSIEIPFSNAFGPGHETNGFQLPLRAASYKTPGCLIQTGVEF
jgi:hypothetical protein